WIRYPSRPGSAKGHFAWSGPQVRHGRSRERHTRRGASRVSRTGTTTCSERLLTGRRHAVSQRAGRSPQRNAAAAPRLAAAAVRPENVGPQENPNQQRNMMLFFLVSMALLFVYTTFFMPEPPPAAEATEETVADGKTADTARPAEGETATPPTGAEPEAREVPERALTLTRPEAVYAVHSHGGGLSSALLQGEKMREQRRMNFRQGLQALMGNPPEPAPQMNLAQPPAGGPLPLAVSIEGDAPLSASTPYLLEEIEGGQGVDMEAVGNGWKVEKRLRFEREGFEFAYELVITNTTGAPRRGELAFHWTRAIDPEFEEAPSLMGSVGNQSRVSCFVNDDQEALLPGDEKAPIRHNGAIRSFGIDQQ